MSVGGMICLFLFLIVTAFATLAVLAHNNIYDFLQSIWAPVFIVFYIAIFVFFRIGKRLARK